MFLMFKNSQKVSSVNLQEKAKVKTINNDIKVFKHNFGDAGYDVYLTKDVWIWPLKVKKLLLNCAIEIPSGYFARVTGRSGQTLKGNVTLSGTVDSSFRGQISVLMTRIGWLPKRLKKGTRVAQIIIMPYAEINWQHTSNLSDSFRGINGFGSSGDE